MLARPRVLSRLTYIKSWIFILSLFSPILCKYFRPVLLIDMPIKTELLLLTPLKDKRTAVDGQGSMKQKL
jgi:hypothetical protein